MDQEPINGDGLLDGLINRMFNVKTPLSTLNLDIRQDRAACRHSDVCVWGGGGKGHPDPERRGMPGLAK